MSGSKKTVVLRLFEGSLGREVRIVALLPRWGWLRDCRHTPLFCLALLPTNANRDVDRRVRRGDEPGIHPLRQGHEKDKAMKIQGPSGRPNAVDAVSGVPPAAKAGQPSGPAPAESASTDQAQLSNLAQLAAASEESPNHIAKLSSLSATVSSGRYQVEAGVLSNAIIEASIHLSGGNYA
jgi:hypothetical protein